MVGSSVRYFMLLMRSSTYRSLSMCWGKGATLPDRLSDVPMSYLLLTAESIQMSLQPVLTVQGQPFNGAGHEGRGSF